MQAFTANNSIPNSLLAFTIISLLALVPNSSGSAIEIESLIRDLEQPTFNVRESATGKLIALQDGAIKPLAVKYLSLIHI